MFFINCIAECTSCVVLVVCGLNDLLGCTTAVVHCLTLPHVVVEMKMVCGIWRSVVRTDW